MMFSLSFVGGSKSAEGAISASGFGPGGPNIGGSEYAGTPASTKTWNDL